MAQATETRIMCRGVCYLAPGLSILFRKHTQGVLCFSACRHTVMVCACNSFKKTLCIRSVNRPENSFANPVSAETNKYGQGQRGF